MSEIRVRVAENGFIVEQGGIDGFMGKQWAFESAQALSELIFKWGSENTKVKDQTALVEGELGYSESR